MKKFLFFLSVLILLVSCEEYSKTEEEASYESVIIIGLDGAGSFVENSSINGFSELFGENSAIGYHCTCEYPSISGQNWGSYLHGVSPSTHKCVNTSMRFERFPLLKYPSIFKIVRNIYPDSKLASFCEWNPINYGLIEPSAKVQKSSDARFRDYVHDTEEIKTMTLEYLAKETPKLLFVHLDNADAAGHSKGYGSAEQIAEIQKDVDFINQVYSFIDHNKTLLVVVADHGGLGQTHGGRSDSEMDITIALKGHTVNQMALDENCTPKNVAVIVLKALGIKKPSNMEGTIPQGLSL